MVFLRSLQIFFMTVAEKPALEKSNELDHKSFQLQMVFYTGGVVDPLL